MVLVRPARGDELPACAALYERVLKSTFTWMAPDQHRADDFLAAARYEEVFVAVDGETILGVLSLFQPGDFVHSLYVDERGRGVGKALLDHVQAQVSGPLCLKVQAPNARAQAFYVREGFRVVEKGHDPVVGVAWLRMSR